MICRICGVRPAKEYIRRADGKEIKLEICPECYRELYGTEKSDFYAAFMGGMGESAKRICPNCGTSFEEFRASGLLGCAHCYVAFREELLPTIRYIHGADRHAGGDHAGEDGGSEERYDRLRELAARQEALKKAIEEADRAGDDAGRRELAARLEAVNRKLYGGEDRE